MARYQAKVDKLRAEGYHSTTKGAERLGELQGRVEMMKRGYLRVGHGKFNGSGHGIDAIYRHVGSGEIAILESKFSGNWKGTWNPKSLMKRGYGYDQMSDGWIRAVRDRMHISQSLHANRMGALLDSGGWQHRYVNVMNSSGGSFVSTCTW